MTTKELVYWIEDVPGVTCHDVHKDSVSISNGLIGFTAKVAISELTSYEKIRSPQDEIAIQLDFEGPRRLFITPSEFAFSTHQSSIFKVNGLPPVIGLTEMIARLDHYAAMESDGNLDALQGEFYLNYYSLESAAYFGFEIDRYISKLHDIAEHQYFFNRDELPLFGGVYLGNKGLLLPKLKTEHSYGILDFIGHWKKLYAYDNPEQYKPIHIKTLSLQDLEDLYVWKNGMKLSAAKLKSFHTKISPKLDLINSLRQDKDFNLDSFLKEFDNVSAVWKIFLLHIIKPTTYPIYDQHIHRAFQHINGKDITGISADMNDKTKLNFYFNEYLPFVIKMNVSNLKEMDEAFFAFGQFLNIGNQKLIVE